MAHISCPSDERYINVAHSWRICGLLMDDYYQLDMEYVHTCLYE